MRVSIAIFTLLVVGSNAGLLSGVVSPVSGVLGPVSGILSPVPGLLGPATNILDSINAQSQATSLFSSLNSQIGQLGNTAVINVEGELQKVKDAVQNLQNRALFIAKGLADQGVPGASDLVSVLTNIIAEVLLLVDRLLKALLGDVGSILVLVPEPQDLSSQIKLVITKFQSQIAALYNPFIATLGSDIASGKVKLQCFNNEVPEIQGNNSAVVAEVAAALKNTTDAFTLQVAVVLAKIDADLVFLNNGVILCSTNGTCQVQLVTSRLTLLRLELT